MTAPLSLVLLSFLICCSLSRLSPPWLLGGVSGAGNLFCEFECFFLFIRLIESRRVSSTFLMVLARLVRLLVFSPNSCGCRSGGSLRCLYPPTHSKYMSSTSTGSEHSIWIDCSGVEGRSAIVDLVRLNGLSSAKDYTSINQLAQVSWLRCEFLRYVQFWTNR